MRIVPFLLLAACVPEEGPAAADNVLWAPGASDRAFGDPRLAINGVRGAGSSAGSTDVYSMLTEGDEAALAVEWTAGVIVDGPGVDLVVYENPFEHASGTFLDPVIVEVSEDGETWVPFPHDYIAADETAYSADPADWVGFAGLTPVQLHDKRNPTDPLDPEVSGGDGFDLADVPDVSEVCCVRMWSASAWINPDTGEPYPRDPVGNGADIDGVYGHVTP